MLIGYARVSTPQQNLEAQIQQLEAADCDIVFKEKHTGYDADRPALREMVKMASPGDTVIIASLDRLGRSTSDIFKLTEELEAKSVMFKSLREPWADTTSTMGKFLLTVFAGISELERSMTLDRCEAGRQAAKERGVKFGRKPKLTSHQARAALDMLDEGQSMREIAKTFNVSASTIHRVKERQALAASPKDKKLRAV